MVAAVENRHRPSLWVIPNNQEPNQQVIDIRDYLKEEEKEPFAFDLSRECELIQLYGESYKEFFLTQAHYYAKETYGKTPTVTYEHALVRDSLGNVELVFGPHKERARASYMRPKNDTSLPKWYRDRAAADEEWTIALEEKLASARPGDRFIDLSPTVFEIPIEERAKWNFSWHSFVRVHEVVIEEGEEKLVSNSIRNYLDLPEQEILFSQLSGEQLAGNNLLGAVGKLRLTMEIGHIQHLITKLYEETPLERKIAVPASDQVARSDQEMEAILTEYDSWLLGIFQLMQQGFPDQLIEDQFHGWENAVKRSVRGQGIDSAYFRSLATKHFVLEIQRHGTPLARFTEEEYKPQANGCGNGSGFGKKKKQLGGSMDYRSMTLNEKEWSYHTGDCVVCKAKNVEVGPCDICKSCEEKFAEGGQFSELASTPLIIFPSETVEEGLILAA